MGPSLREYFELADRLIHHPGKRDGVQSISQNTWKLASSHYNAPMSTSDTPVKSWKFSTRDLLWLTTVVAIAFGGATYAIKNAVSTFPQLIMLLASWHVLAGCIGALLWWFRFGSTADMVDGFVLGAIVATLLPLMISIL